LLKKELSSGISPFGKGPFRKLSPLTPREHPVRVRNMSGSFLMNQSPNHAAKLPLRELFHPLSRLMNQKKKLLMSIGRKS
jgi:hypothetical protein